MPEPKPRYIIIKPQWLFNNPRMLDTLTSGIMIDWNGMTIAATNKKKMTVEIQCFVRTSFHAAIDVKMTMKRFAPAVMKSELKKTRP